MSNPRVSQIRKRAKLTRRLFGTVSRPIPFLSLLFILLATALYAGSSASSARPKSNGSRPESAAGGQDKLLKGARASSNKVGAPLGPRAAAIPGPASPVVLPPQEVVYDPETITTYAGDCVTPKSSFNFGDIVCAKVEGGYPLEISPRRVTWVGPDDVLRDQDQSQGEPFTYYAPVSTIGETFMFTLPARDPNVDERGVWRVTSVTSRSSVRAAAYFTVSDPNDNVADLVVSNSVNTDANNVASGTNVEFAVWLINRGPDAALNVSLANVVPAGASFVDLQQDDGPAFNCPSGAAGPCTLASLGAGQSARIRYVYATSSTAAVGTAIVNTATISSDTTEQSPDSNTASAALAITTTGGANACGIVCPDNITKVADSVLNGQPGASVTFSNGEVSGDCGAVTANPASSSFFPVGTTTVTVTTGSGESCTFNVEVLPAGAAPTISCPAPVTVDSGGSCSAENVSLGEPTTGGGNGQLSVSATRSDGQDLDAPYPLGTTTITWTVTDESTASSSCTQTVTVTGSDTTKPTITAPANITIGTGADAISCGAIVGETELGTADATDDCTGAVTILRTGVPAGNFFPLGSTTITYRARDAAGNLSDPATQTVTITDDTPPRITAPADPSTTYVCPSDVPAANPADATLGAVDENNNQLPPDNCSVPTVSVTESRSGAGSASSPLIITRTFTATDAAGNTASDDQVITVIDNVAPTLALNGANSVTVECHTSWDDPGATASDNCADAGEATRSGALDLNTPGTYTLTYNATDAAGNAAPPVTRTVTVVDTTKPVIALSGASTMTVECHTSFSDPGATASDSCDSSVPVAVTGSVDVNTPGTYTLTYNASDDSGNQADTVTRTVTVVDTTPPVITLKNVNISFWPPNHNLRTVTVADLVASASDSCDTPLSVNDVFISQVSSDEAANGNGDGNTGADIVIAGNGCKSVQLRSERNGNGDGRVYTITFKVRDASGNVGTATAKVTVPRSSNSAAVDGGAAYTVSSSCQ
jgi:uncharacterized repeat protein (TIGR01451 family)